MTNITSGVIIYLKNRIRGKVMRVGDLVTLSSRGKKLEACWRWSREAIRKGDAGTPNKLVGLVTAIKESPYSYATAVGGGELQYTVQWVGKGPKGRTHWHCNYWHRSDLKFVAKAK